MEERFIKLKELLSNEETAKKLLTLSAEDAAGVLAEEYGVNFTVEELNDIVLGIQDSIKEKNSSELSETDLDMVSGGGKGSESYNFGKSVGAATPVVFAMICIGVAMGW